MRTVGPTVLLLGLTSFFTDVSAEMVSAVLPVYLIFAVGATPLQLGVIDGIYHGGAAIVRILSGVSADRTHRHKLVASIGYGVSAACKLGLVLASGAVAAITAVTLADRTGKAIRTAPRDAMISLSSRPELLGLAFGVHRAMDTAGAVLGPLLAAGLLFLAPGSYDAVFLVSFVIALVGVATITLLVPATTGRARGEPAAATARKRASVRSAGALLRRPGFRRVTLLAWGMALVTISDAFIFLGIQDRLDFAPLLLPLLFVGAALAFMLLAIPVGRLADVVGRGRVFIGGYVMLALTYTSLTLPTVGPAALAVYFLLIGSYYAATDGVLAAMASATLPDDHRASGLGLVAAGVGVMKLLSSVVFGALWTVAGLNTALLVFSALLIAAIVLAILALRSPSG